MDMMDSFALLGLGWIYDKVEDRYGRAAALIVTWTLAIGILAAIVAVIMTIL